MTTRGTYAGRFDGIGPRRNNQESDLSKILDDGEPDGRHPDAGRGGRRAPGGRAGGCRQFSPSLNATPRTPQRRRAYVRTWRSSTRASVEGSYTSGSPQPRRTTIGSNASRRPCHSAQLGPRRSRRPKASRRHGRSAPRVADLIFCDGVAGVKVQFRWTRQRPGQNAEGVVRDPGGATLRRTTGGDHLPRIGQEVTSGSSRETPTSQSFIVGSVHMRGTSQMPPFNTCPTRNPVRDQDRTVALRGAPQPKFLRIRF